MKNRLQKESLVSLIVGLVLAAFVVPWSLSTIKKSNELLKHQQEMHASEVPSGEQGAYAGQQSAYEQAAQRERDGQTASRKIEPDNIAIPRPAHPARASEPSRSAYSVVPAGTPELAPLEGWVDQPNTDRPGRIHTNLKWRWSEHATAKPVKTGRAVCLKTQQRPAERIQLSYGWVDLPARTVQVACSSGGFS